MKQKLETARQKKDVFLQEIYFFIKGMDTKEDIVRIVRIASMIGVSVLVIMLTGRTIQYVTREKQPVHETTQVTKETQVIHANPTLQEQYKKLLNRVEKLTKENKQENEQQKQENEHIVVENGKDGVDGIDGKQGVGGENGRDGRDGLDGKAGLNGNNGKDGKDGKSAYVQAVEAGYTGTEADFVRTMATAENRIQIVETGLQSTSEAVTSVNNNLNSTSELLNNHINQMQQIIGEMNENFQNGCNIISAAITAQGVETQPNATPNSMADNIGRLAEIKYKQGYVDGVSSVGVAGVEYEYHYHDGNEQEGGACFSEAEYHRHDTSGCYGICSNSWLGYIEDHYDGNHDHKYTYECGACRFRYENYGSEGKRLLMTHVSMIPTCGKSENQFLRYKCTCGRGDGEIISAKIIY